MTAITKAKRGRPLAGDRDKTLVAMKPWLDLGMSESTWRRRQAEGRINKWLEGGKKPKSNRGRPLKGEEPRPKPWIALGMSESTWRRRQKGPRKDPNHWRRAPA